jgi:hypothetical protein
VRRIPSFFAAFAGYWSIFFGGNEDSLLLLVTMAGNCGA